MKTRYLFVAAVLLIITLLAACKDENPFVDRFVPRELEDLPENLRAGYQKDSEKSYLTVDPTSLSFGSEAALHDVAVSTNASTAYSITSSNSEWLTATASSDRKTLTVSVTENTTTSSRSGTITLTVSGLTATIAVTQFEGSTPSSGDPEAVDLGLPSGTKWANMNVGASSPEDYGLYFAWGETVGYGSDTSDGRSFDWASYKWMNSGQSSWQQVNKYQVADGQTNGCWYNSSGTFIGDGKSILDLSDDAAYVNWGSTWRMPTDDEMQELLNNTTSEWTTQNGVYGRRFTGTNGKSIFLPAAGSRIGSSLYDQGSSGDYCSSSLFPSYSGRARDLYFYSGDARASGNDRCSGQSVRPVLRN